MEIKIADMGMVSANNHAVSERCGYRYGPPERVIEGRQIIDGEKADVFATGFILLALLLRRTLGSEEQCESPTYKEI